MTTYSVLAKHVRKIAHYEGIREGQASVLRTAARALEGHPEELAAAWDEGAKAINTLLMQYESIGIDPPQNPYREDES